MVIQEVLLISPKYLQNFLCCVSRNLKVQDEPYYSSSRLEQVSYHLDYYNLLLEYYCNLHRFTASSCHTISKVKHLTPNTFKVIPNIRDLYFQLYKDQNERNLVQKASTLYTVKADNPKKSDTTNSHLNASVYLPLKYPLSKRSFTLHMELQAKDLFHCNKGSQSFLTQILQQMPRLFTAEANSGYLLSYY